MSKVVFFTVENHIFQVVLYVFQVWVVITRHATLPKFENSIIPSEKYVYVAYNLFRVGFLLRNHVFQVVLCSFHNIGGNHKLNVSSDC